MPMRAHDIRTRIRDLPRRWKRVVLISFDVVALIVVLWCSYSLRLGLFFVPSLVQFGLILAAPAIAVPIFIRIGLYRAVIRYLPERAIWAAIRGMTLAALLWICLLFLTEMSGLQGAPRSIPIFYWLLGIWTVAGSRFAAKALLWPQRPGGDSLRRQVLIYGADEAGLQLAAALRERADQLVAGFVDDNSALHGRDIMGLRVYPESALPDLIENFGVREILVSLPAIDQVRRREILGRLSNQPIRIRALPPMSEITSGRMLVGQLRDLDIDDLLGRSVVPPQAELFEDLLTDKVVLISGAGGSIGSELCRLVMRWKPKKLIMLDISEFGLYQVEKSLAVPEGAAVECVLGSVCDETLVHRVFERNAVDVVFHAAAYKHVPLVEANVVEAARNNVFGAETFARCSFEAGVSHYVLISSDKAVRPTNVMGATKRWAELITRRYAELAASQGTGQLYCVVRFGNVLGSSGSVVPLFRRQIEEGGPITLTDERMTRYFMSIHEAAELIVQAGALSEGGDIFLLDMGKQIRIRTLAENMIRLAGMMEKTPERPDGDIEIRVTGARPGEKLAEELFYDPSNAATTRHPKILRTRRSDMVEEAVSEALCALSKLIAAGDDAATRAKLLSFIQEG
ncbi:MAG: polysaccharide biosynthesis protein [Pararhizobium sp.]